MKCVLMWHVISISAFLTRQKPVRLIMPPMEAFNAILKKEEVYLSVYHDFDSANLKLFEYIHGFYNRSRIHGSIDFMSPIAFEQLALNS